MGKERFRAYVACYLLLRKGNRILLHRRCNTGYQDGKYDPISGHLDGNESVVAAMTREAKEEAGLIIREKDLKVVHVVHRISSDREYVDFFLEARKWKGTPRIMEPEKCDDMRWFEERRLPKNTIRYVVKVLKRINAGKEFFSYYNFRK